jgi:hypothetical protein
MILAAQPFHFLPEPAIFIGHMLQRYVLLPHGGDPLVQRRHGFERQSDELANRPVEIVEKTLTLSGEKEESRQEEGKQS